MRRGDSERAFRAARVHSRWIRVLRLAVPVSVIVLVVGFVLWTWFNPLRMLAAVPDIVAGDSVVSGTKITMQQPKITGFTKDSRPYQFTAKAAAQELTKPDLVELHDLNGKFQMRDSNTANVTSPSGTYNSKQEMLQLGQHTVVISSNGYHVVLDDALIDIRNATLTTERPVHVEMNEGQLDAQRMDILQSGAVIRFDGVKMTLKGDQFVPPQQGNKQQ